MVQVVLRIIENPHATAGDITLLDEDELGHVQSWNQEVPNEHLLFLPERILENRRVESGPPRKPSNETEHTIQQICADILEIAPADVNLDVDFFNMGGDSIRVMQLISRARRANLPITARQVFRTPILADLARAVSLPAAPSQPSIALGQPPEDLGPEVIEHLSWPQLPFQKNDVTDILPCTEVQAFSATRPQYYWSLELIGALKYDRFKLACANLVHRHAILRTVFVPDAGHILQVVLHQLPLSFTECETENDDLIAFTKTLTQADSVSQVLYNKPPLAFALVRQHYSHHMLILQLSHAQYDGISIPTLITDLLDLYHQQIQMQAAVTFAAYTRHCTHSHTAEAYGFWRDLLNRASMTSPFETDISNLLLKANASLVKVEACAPLPVPPPGITMATIIKAAWSITQARILRNTRDLVFGQLVSGRSNLSEAGLEDVIGPCLDFVPVRAVLQSTCDDGDGDGETISALLRRLQDQHAASLPFETVPLKAIVARCTSWTDRDTDFGSIVHHRHAPEQTNLQLGSLECHVDIWGPVSLPNKNIWVTSSVDEAKQ